MQHCYLQRLLAAPAFITAPGTAHRRTLHAMCTDQSAKESTSAESSDIAALLSKSLVGYKQRAHLRHVPVALPP